MPDYGLSAGIPQSPVGLPDKEFNLLLPLYAAINGLAQSVSDVAGLTTYSQAEQAQQSQLKAVRTQSATRLSVYAPSALDYGKVVHLYLNSDKIAAEEASSATNAKPAQGVVNSPLGIEAGQYGDVLLFTGYTLGITGTTVGAVYYLSTAGNVSTTRPAAAGTTIQAVGVGLGSAGFYLNISSLFIQN